MTDTPDSAPQTHEIHVLRAEVARLRQALGEDGWRLRRLAELGVAQAKLNHDLRNILSSALMVADRLQSAEDAKVSRSGRVIVSALEQAAALIATSLDFASEAKPALAISRFPFSAVIEELQPELCAQHQNFAIENTAPADLHVEADRALFARAVGHLLRTAAEAQARRMAIAAERQADRIVVQFTDDGRPFREQKLANALSPFSGAFRYGSSGLDLVIARDLIEAHGGTIGLAAGSGPESTCMELILPATPRP